MKKLSIIFSFFFLALTIGSNEASAAIKCAGTPTACNTRSTEISCVGSSGSNANVAGTASNGGCTWTAATFECGATSGVTASCSGIIDAVICSEVPNCYKLVDASTDSNAFVTTICNALKIITGTGGKAFAAFAIVSVGIGFFSGKVSWGLMIGVTAGIAAMFGAPTIVAAISGGTASDCGAAVAG